jgi:hypothetical protein
MEIQKNFKILSVEKDEQGRFRLKIKNPAFLPVVLLIFVMVISFFYLAVKQITDKYYPYEGKIIRIERKWYDTFLFETNYDEHLTIETPSGEIIDRYVDMFERVNNRIEPDDYIIKTKGFGQAPRAKGKKTADKMIEELQERVY